MHNSNLDVRTAGLSCCSQQTFYVLFLSTGGLTRDSSGMFGTLDLGGGSTQITLNPVDLVCI